MRSKLSILILLMLASSLSMKASGSPDSLVKVEKNVKFGNKMIITNKKDWSRFHQSRKPDPKLSEKLKKQNPDFFKEDGTEKIPQTKPQLIKKNESIQSLSQVRIPGEFEESQGVLISWPFYCFDKDSNYLSPFYKGFGYNDNNQLLKIEYTVLDLFSDSPYSKLWTDLTFAINQECTALIRLPKLSDSTDLLDWMKTNGKTLTNYQFFSQPDYGDDIWARDYGPWGVYYGNQDSIALVDFGYYPDRPSDDSASYYLGKLLNVPVISSSVEIEGGNYMCDGYGTGFASNVFFQNNADNIGFAGNSKKIMTKAQVIDSLNKSLNMTNFTIFKALQCDGGTGHIDLYLKMINEYTIISTEYPDEFNNTQFPDYKIAKSSIDSINKLSTIYKDKYNILTLPLPTTDLGQYYPNCDSVYSDARTYINGLTVNKTFIMPIYSDENSGNLAQDKSAIAKLHQYLPGYKIVPIDARILCANGGGGELHCVTMQIPANNPLLIAHKQPSTSVPQNYVVNAAISNNSGIKNAYIYWRIADKGDNWTKLDMIQQSGNNYQATIIFPSLPNIIEYYIEANSNNGKTKYSPYTAPDNLWIANSGFTGVDDQNNSINLNYFTDKDYNNLTIQLQSSLSNFNNEIRISNILGNILVSKNLDQKSNVSIPINFLNNGTYFITITNVNDTKSFKFNILR